MKDKIFSFLDYAGLYNDASIFLMKIGVLIASFVAPVKGMMLVLLILVVIDLLTGLAAAFKLRQKITSAKLSRSVTKLMVYLITILLMQLANNYVILAEEIPLTRMIASFIVLTELQSVLENLNKITNQTFLQHLIDKLSLVTKGRHIESKKKSTKK